MPEPRELPEKVQWVVELMKDDELNWQMARKIWRATLHDGGFGLKFEDLDMGDQNGFRRQAHEALDAVLSRVIFLSLSGD